MMLNTLRVTTSIALEYQRMERYCAVRQRYDIHTRDLDENLINARAECDADKKCQVSTTHLILSDNIPCLLPPSLTPRFHS